MRNDGIVVSGLTRSLAFEVADPNNPFPVSCTALALVPPAAFPSASCRADADGALPPHQMGTIPISLGGPPKVRKEEERERERERGRPEGSSMCRVPPAGRQRLLSN